MDDEIAEHLRMLRCDQRGSAFVQPQHDHLHARHGPEIGAAELVHKRGFEQRKELSLGIDQRIKLGQLASSTHVYPTYAIGVQQLAAELRLYSLAASRTVKLARRLASLRRS